MKILYPLGFLGLSAILLLILIYILKPKYQEKAVASTLVWKLSLKYRRQKLPLEWLKSSLLFILQVLVIAVVAFMLVRPLVVLQSKSGEKIVVLDASASMLAEKNGKTRFERAVSDIGKLAELTVPEDRFTVIVAADEPYVVARREDNADYIKQLLANESCAFGSADLDGAMKLAEDVLKENPNAEVVLYTGDQYRGAEGVTVKNMSASEWNASVLDCSIAREDGYYVVTAEVASFNKNADLAVVLNVDGQYKAAKLAPCRDDKPVTLKWDNVKLTRYADAEVYIEGAKDAFAYDNSFRLYGGDKKQFAVQLVSESPAFLDAALNVVGTCDVTLPTEESPAELSGFDLYVYDGTVPETLPADGAVLFVNPPSDPPGTGLTVGEPVSGRYALTTKTGSSETYRTIMEHVNPGGIELTKYTRLDSYLGFEPLMYCNGDPVLLAKNHNGARVTVMAFDLSFSTLPVQIDFWILVNNICAYSMRPTVDRYVFCAGETVALRERASAVGMNVKTGDFSADYDAFPVSITAERPGVYTVTQTLGGGDTRTDSFFVRVARRECDFTTTIDTLTLPAVAGTGTDVNVSNDTLDVFPYLALALLALLVVEWGVQYREQY